MNKKQIRILIVASIIIVLLIFFVILFRDKLNKPVIVETKKAENIVNSNITTTEENKNTEMVAAKDEDVNLGVVSVARNFIERYGSWSTDNKENNFVTANVYATDNMKNNMKDFISNIEQLKDGYNGYYGVTTKAVSTKVISSDESSAKISVDFQKTDNSGATSYGNAELQMSKQGDKWFVDNLIYQ
jgi:hypothetical protein